MRISPLSCCLSTPVAVRRFLLLPLLVGFGLMVAGCLDQSAAPPPATAAKETAAENSGSNQRRESAGGAIATKSPPSKASSTNSAGPVIDGEHFTVRQIPDPQQGGLVVGIFIAPETWRMKSQVTWNYEYHTSPVSMMTSVENPANEEALYGFPAWQFFTLRPVTSYYRPGQNVGGYIFAEPQPPAQTLLTFIQQARGGHSKFQVVGSKDLPDLPNALKAPPSPNQRGIGIKITYELKGHPVEEEFYAIYYSTDIPYDGPQGRTWQRNWGLFGLHSFRAPAGTLDKRRPVFAAMIKSFRPNPAWEERKSAVLAFLAEQFNRQLQAGYDSIAAAGQLSRQISANNDAMIASIDRQLQTARSSRSSASASRSANDKFSDYIRGVDTMDDPYYGTSQHAYTEKYHWTDGYGSYRNSNEAGYDPNQHEKGNWQLMTPTR